MPLPCASSRHMATLHAQMRSISAWISRWLITSSCHHASLSGHRWFLQSFRRSFVWLSCSTRSPSRISARTTRPSALLAQVSTNSSLPLCSGAPSVRRRCGGSAGNMLRHSSAFLWACLLWSSSGSSAIGIKVAGSYARLARLS